MRKIFSVFVLLCLPVLAIAQPGFGGGVVDGAPVDGGLSMLFVAGASYGVKKFYDRKKAKSTIDETEELDEN